MGISHRWSWETRTRRKRLVTGGFDPIHQHRMVCTCGETTRWFRDDRLAQAEAASHALDGQQAFA